MKTHTTLTLRKLILNDMDASKHEMSGQEINNWMQCLPDVIAEMSKTMDFFICSIFQKAMVRRQIAQIQSECIYLLNAIDKKELTGEMAKLKTAVIKCLDAILERVQTHGRRYIDEEMTMPCLHLKRAQTELEGQILLLYSKMKLNRVEAPLFCLISNCFDAWRRSSKCTYARLSYLRSLLDALLQILEKTSVQFASAELRDHLFEVDFNCPSFIKYMQENIRDELKEIYEVKLQFEKLAAYQRQYEVKNFRKSAPRFDAHFQRSREVMNGFVNAEIKYLREQQQPAQVLQVYPAAVPSDYKIRFQLSVDALAYFIKLMVNARMIDPGLRTELLSFVSRTFITPGVSANGISAGSLGVKYKQVVQRTATQVRAALQRMLKDLDQEFGFN